MMLRRIKWTCVGLTISLFAGTLLGCSAKPVVVSGDILSQKPVLEGRIPITILVKHAFSLNEFEKIVEEKFSDIDIIQVNNYTRDMGIEEYKSRLEHEDLTDIVMTWPIDVGEEYWQDRLIDLSKFDFTNRYNLSILNDISREGRLYYLPGPSQLRGLVYNKTLFEENGWEVPEDFEGFIALCKTIEQSGIRSVQLGFQNGEVLETAFIGYGYGNCFSQPDDNKWIREYGQGEHSFGDHFGPALDTFEQMMEEGVWKAEDLDIDYAEREAMLFTRQCAMVEDSPLLTQLGYERTGTTDEFALMPFFNPGMNQDWARLYMVCYIGLSKHLEEPKNEEKYDAVLKLMEYISTPEGQEALTEGNKAMYSSLIGAAPPDEPEITPLLPAIQAGRVASFPQMKHIQQALQKGLAGMLRKDMSKEDVIALVDAQNRSQEEVEPPKELGTATQDFTLIETGNFVTDCLQAYSGCDLALFMDNGKDGIHNGKGISGRIYKGAVTQTDVGRIMPDLKHGETGTLWKVSMTGADLIQTLEHSIEVDNGIGGWFYYFSGLRVEYNPKAEPGSRIRKITLADKSKLDEEKVYTVAVMDKTVPEEYIISCEETGVLIADIVAKGIEEQKTISPSMDGRFGVVN